MNQKILDTTRRRLLRFIADYQREHQCPPSTREIAQHISLGTGTTSYHLGVLEREALLTRRPGMARNVRLTARGAQVAAEPSGEEVAP